MSCAPSAELFRAVLISCVAALGGHAQVLHVDDNAPGDPGPNTPLLSNPLEDGTPARPFDAIAEAVAAATPGTTIQLAPGVYAGPGNRDLDFGGKALVLRGPGGPWLAVVNAQSRGRVLRVGSGETAAARLEGLLLANGSAALGGAILVEAGSALTVERCLFLRNLAGSGGALAIDGGTLTLRDSLFFRNQASGPGGALAASGEALVDARRCTFSANAAGSGGAVSADDLAALALLGSIAWQDTAPVGAELHLAGSASLTVEFSNVAGGAAAAALSGSATLDWGPGNLDADPLFLEPAYMNYRLHSGSPCVDSGDPLDLPAPGMADLDGEARLSGVAVDMGADEIVCRAVIAGDCNANGMPDHCELDCNGNALPDACDIKPGGSLDTNLDHIPDECGPFVHVRADDDAPGDPGPGDPLLSDPLEDGSLLRPFDALQEAIDAAMPHDFVIALPGTYAGPGNRDLDFRGRNLNLTGQDGPAGVVIDAQGLGRHIHLHSGELHKAHVKGFTLIHGVGDRGGSILTEDGSVVQVVECILRDNSAQRGGAVAFEGGGETLRNSIVTANLASDAGGGVWIAGADGAFVRGCTIAGNSAGVRGGGLAVDDAQDAKLRGSIVWGNAAPQGAQIALGLGAVLAAFYDDVQGGQAGVLKTGGAVLSWASNNLSVDPRFGGADGLHLTVDSPCIDTGFPGYVPQPGETDIDREPRILGPGGVSGAGAIQDMGADEIFCQADLGFAGPGSLRLALCGDDLSERDSSGTLRLSGAAGVAPVFLVLGDVFDPTPAKGGTLVPVPWLLLLTGLATDAAGTLEIVVPGGFGPFTIYAQAVVPSGPAFHFSNAIAIEE